MKRLEELFKNKKNILNIYLTAGFPKWNDTVSIVQTLEKNGVDVVEIGMPFSDPLADGPTIQASSQIAIKNGITLAKIFEQVAEIRKTVSIPIILMGYYNQMMQYGDLEFLKKAKEVGVDGFIIPDLPLDIYQEKYQQEMEEMALDMIFLITPQTTEERVREIDNNCSGFLYMVSSYATTGSKSDISNAQIEYFERIKNYNLKNPTLIGFGISNKETFDTACNHANGAIIGSAFIKAVGEEGDLNENVERFVKEVLSNQQIVNSR